MCNFLLQVLTKKKKEAHFCSIIAQNKKGIEFYVQQQISGKSQSGEMSLMMTTTTSNECTIRPEQKLHKKSQRLDMYNSL